MTAKEAKELARILHTKIDAPTINRIGAMHHVFFEEIDRLEKEWELDRNNLCESEGGPPTRHY